MRGDFAAALLDGLNDHITGDDRIDPQRPPVGLGQKSIHQSRLMKVQPHQLSRLENDSQTVDQWRNDRPPLAGGTGNTTCPLFVPRTEPDDE